MRWEIEKGWDREIKKKGKPQGKPFFFGIEKELDFQAAGRHRSVERAAVAAGIEPAAGFLPDTESIAWLD